MARHPRRRNTAKKCYRVVVNAVNLDDNGWACGVRRAPSPHFTPRPPQEAVTLTIIHGISLPPREFGGDDILRLFAGKLDDGAHPGYAALRGVRVSAHFLVRRDGELIQCVSCRHAAWHAGKSRWNGRTECNDFSIGVELEGADDVAYDDRQYERLALVIAGINRRHSTLVVGHADVAPKRKTDPGGAFNWRRLFKLIGEEYDGRAFA